MKSNYFFSVVIATLLLASPAMADSIVIEAEGSNHYLTFQSDKSISISGYNVQLNFSPGTEIQALEPLEPYIGAVNIQNQKGYAKIVGFTAETTTPKRLATLSYSGAGAFEILVIELCDSDLKSVAVTNPQVDLLASPTATPTIPLYQPAPGYVSPGGRGVDLGQRSVLGASDVGQLTPGVTTTTTSTTATLQETPSSVEEPVETAHSSALIVSKTPAEGGTDAGAQKAPISTSVILGGLTISLILWGSERKPF